MVTPGVELNSNALVVFAVPAPAAGQEALPPLEVKFTVPVLLTVTACCVVRHGAPSLHRRGDPTPSIGDPARVGEARALLS